MSVPDVGEIVRSYTFYVCCRHCGGDVVRQTEGRPGRETRALSWCPRCKRATMYVLQELDVTAEITPVKQWERVA